MSREVRGTVPADKPEPDPVTVVVYDRLPDPSLTKIPFATSVPGNVYVTSPPSELGAFSIIAEVPLLDPSTSFTPLPTVAVLTCQNLPEPTNWLLLVVESIPTYKSYLSTVNPGSPALNPGRSARLPLLNWITGDAI